MDPAVGAELRRGAELLKEGRLLDAQRAFYRAVDGAGKDRAVKLAAAEAWRKAAWGATMGLDDPESGWTMFHNARALYLSLGGAPKLYEVERGMAIAAGKMGEHGEALRCCDDAEAHASDAEERCKVWNTRAVSLGILGRDGEAWTWASKVAATSRAADTLAVARQSLGVLLIRRGRPREALRHLEDDVLRAWALQEAGEFRKALKMAPRNRPRGFAVRARAWLGLGRRDRALAELRRGARIVEAGRAKLNTEAARASFHGAKQEVHDLLVRLCAGEGRWAEAFDRAEAARARSFLDFATEGLRRDLSHLRPSERARFERLRAGIEGDPRLEAEYAMALRRYEKERLAGAGVQPARPLRASEVCRALRKGEAVVEYQAADDAVYAFFLAPRRFLPVKLEAPAEEVLDAARDLARAIAVARRDERAGRGGFFDWHFGRLGGALLGGLPLDGVERLTVVPHGELHRVPFAALRLGGRPLVERCAVSVAPSASVRVMLARKAARAPEPRRCLLVKDPTGTLPHAEAEEEALRERFGSGLTVLAGESATREAVLALAPGQQVLHFATHAVYREERPEFSHLELAGGRKLTASDVLGLDLSACRQATLSACDSARGDASRGGELFGLPRAFLRAGACAIVATLWPVEDHPGIGPFMRRLYASSPPAEALRAAQLEARSAGTPPSLWASFAAIGC